MMLTGANLPVTVRACRRADKSLAAGPQTEAIGSLLEPLGGRLSICRPSIQALKSGTSCSLTRKLDVTSRRHAENP
jgi:hypothetical protein